MQQITENFKKLKALKLDKSMNLSNYQIMNTTFNSTRVDEIPEDDKEKDIELSAGKKMNLTAIPIS